MRTRVENYREARAEAQARANETGRDVLLRRAVEYGREGFNLSEAPRADKRFGSELSAEVVEPERRA